MLEQNIAEFEKTNILKWRDKGFTGKNVNLVVLDVTGKPFSKDKILEPLRYLEKADKKVGHKSHTCALIREVLPLANIYAFRWNGSYSSEIIKWIKENKDMIDGINMSMSVTSTSYEELLELTTLGIPLFVSVGNDSKPYSNRTAKLPTAFGIGAWQENTDSLASYSNYDEDMEFVSYSHIYINTIDSKILLYTGTSCASPFALSIYGMYAEHFKNSVGRKMTVQEVFEFLLKNVDDKEMLGRDPKSGYGLIKLPNEIPTLEKEEVINEMKKASDYLVSFEAGHGLHTRGKETPFIPELGRKIKEWEFNSATANFFDKELKRCGFKTLYISPDAEDMPLKQRTDLANIAKSNIHVSFHYNALDGKFDAVDPDGHSVHIYPGSKEGRKLAQSILKYLVLGTPQKNRGIVEQNLHITRETNMPAVLIENGFMDNTKEWAYMLNENFQKEVAREVAMGVCDYFNVAYVKEGEVPVKPKPELSDWDKKPMNEPVTKKELLMLFGHLDKPELPPVITPPPIVKPPRTNPYTIRRFGSNIHIYETSPEMFVAPTLGERFKREKLTKVLKDKLSEGVLLGINLGFFNSDELSEHLGLFINKGLYYNPPNPDMMDFIFYRNGTTKIVNYKEYNQAELSELQSIAYWAIGTSYSLVQNGEFNIENFNKFSHSTSKHPRTSIGQRLDGTFVLAVTDGRVDGNAGLTAQEQAELMLELKCYNAINGDGGGSSEMAEVKNGEIVIVNKLKDNYERPLGSMLVVYASKPEDA